MIREKKCFTDLRSHLSKNLILKANRCFWVDFEKGEENKDENHKLLYKVFTSKKRRKQSGFKQIKDDHGNIIRTNT